VQGTIVFRIRTAEDLEELWALLRKPQSQSNVAIWCDGLAGEADTTPASTRIVKERSRLKLLVLKWQARSMLALTRGFRL
jgi:hypothetical protein